MAWPPWSGVVGTLFGERPFAGVPVEGVGREGEEAKLRVVGHGEHDPAGARSPRLYSKLAQGGEISVVARVARVLLVISVHHLRVRRREEGFVGFGADVPDPDSGGDPLLA